MNAKNQKLCSQHSFDGLSGRGGAGGPAPLLFFFTITNLL